MEEKGIKKIKNQSRRKHNKKKKRTGERMRNRGQQIIG